MRNPTPLFCLILVLVAATLLLPGCGSAARDEGLSTAPHAGEDITARKQLASTSTSEFVPRARFNDTNFGRVTPRELGKEYGFELIVPTDAAGGKYEGVFEAPPTGSIRTWLAVYSNDIVIEIMMLPTASDAQEWIRTDITGPFADFVTTESVGDTTVYTIPQLTREPSRDAVSGETMGFVSTAAAKVLWTRGRFVVQVMNPSKSVADLLRVARDLRFTPTTSEPSN